MDSIDVVGAFSLVGHSGVDVVCSKVVLDVVASLVSCEVSGHWLDDGVGGKVEGRTIPLVVDSVVCADSTVVVTDVAASLVSVATDDIVVCVTSCSPVVDSVKMSSKDVVVAGSNVVADWLVSCVTGNSLDIVAGGVVKEGRVSVVDSLEISEKDVVIGSVDKCASVKVVVVKTESVEVC